MTDEQIVHSIETNKLTLSSWEKFTHYGIVIFLFFIPTLIVFLYFKDFINGTAKEFNVGMLLMITIPSVLGLLFYDLQRDRLNFMVIETNLTRDELQKIIHMVSQELKWTIITNNKKIIEAKTSPSFFSGSWGEQITILFDNNRVLVNSICDLDKQSSVVSMGRNRNNTDRLINEIAKDNVSDVPEETTLIHKDFRLQ